uniref:Uncharacterized protein n=1 Tax=Moniliophthora roreri TaxID=221103 RepID=A0A0W0G1C9_MONRR
MRNNSRSLIGTDDTTVY